MENNKSKKFVKGSIEAREFMSNLRSKRGSKEKTIETPYNSPDQETKKCKKNINVNNSLISNTIYKCLDLCKIITLVV